MKMTVTRLVSTGVLAFALSFKPQTSESVLKAPIPRSLGKKPMGR